MLIARDVVKAYGPVTALDGLSLTVSAGEICGLIGHNGAGKSTFVRAVCGLERIDSGSLSVSGRVGVSPQETCVYPTLTVRAQLRLFASLAGVGRAAIEEVAEELGLSPVLDRVVGRLSGGQQRRTQAACALIGDPPVLLLDEPTVGADPSTRAALLSAVRARAAAGAAVVYTTHYLPELVDLGASLAILHAGRIVRRGSQESLLRHLPGRLRVSFADDAGVDIQTADPGHALADLLATGRVPTAVEISRPSLDDLFMSITEARDAA
ncbi:ABC transporter ATP-binding protein [Fodinicola acaciae]|uniref:ABC transporter ATP-binding protein n=1 Tax=Fodinicola acaciae TaxID=2681555 RepID=UPI0013D54B06|nr:ABC transporter ATP-binding protein [Fodinicola acaciae]